METIKRYITEALHDNDKSILTLLNSMAACSSGVYKALFDQKVKDADSINIELMNDILEEQEISDLNKHGDIRPKECFRNAFIVCERLEARGHNVKYCEGYINMKGFPIEHAFVKVDEHYIDPTVELALKRDPTEDRYVVIGEFTTNEVRTVIIENEFWGQIYDSIFLNKYKENVK